MNRQKDERHLLVDKAFGRMLRIEAVKQGKTIPEFTRELAKDYQEPPMFEPLFKLGSKKDEKRFNFRI